MRTKATEYTNHVKIKLRLSKPFLTRNKKNNTILKGQRDGKTLQTETDLFDLGEDTEGESIACLFRCVILQAIADSSATPNPKDTKKIIERARAREWLLNDGDDFAFVCDIAGESATELRTKITGIAWRGWKKTDCDPATVMKLKKKKNRRRRKARLFFD